MKNKYRNIEEEINLTMQSTQGIERAKANSFLYEKVITRINTSDIPSEEPGWNYNRGIKYALVMLAFIVLNIATIVQISGDTGSVKTIKQNSGETSPKESKGYFDDFINETDYNF